MSRRRPFGWLPIARPNPIRTGLVITVCFTLPQPVIAQCVQNQQLWFSAVAPSIGFSGGPTDTKTYAIGKWNSCEGMGPQFPELRPSGDGAVNVTIALKNGQGPGGICGNADPNTDTINLWQTGLTAPDTNGVRHAFNCSRKDTLAHEIGHVLGLANVGLGPNGVPNGTCTSHMMGPGPSPQPCGDGLCGAPRGNPQAGECDRVKDRWNPPVGGGGGGCPPNCEPCDDCSPVVIDVLGDGLRFTDADSGVDFDIMRVGRSVQLGWTTPRGNDVFIALDRNGNGFVDDGGELFGNYTDQPKSDEPNGYDALAVFDRAEFHGNGDGRIDGSDGIYDLLLLWHDQDKNGVSESHELYYLEEAGIDSIYLDYWRSGERDKYGNELRYFGRVCLSARTDTFAHWLAVQAPPEEACTVQSVLDPMGLRDGNVPAAVWSTQCDGLIVQSTDVFFVNGGWSDP